MAFYLNFHKCFLFHIKHYNLKKKNISEEEEGHNNSKQIVKAPPSLSFWWPLLS